MAAPVLKESVGLRYFTFFYLYVMQGIPSGFALTAVYNYLIGKGQTAEAVGSFAAIVGIPWTFQFVWGPLIDKYQYSVIGHRKQWVVLTQLVAVVASLSLLLIHDPVAQLPLMSALFFTHSIFASVQDASVDAIAIEVTPEAERGRVNGLMRAGYLMGISFGAAVLSFMLHHYGFYQAALTQSMVLLALTVLTFFIRLDRHDKLIPQFGTRQTQVEAAQNPSLRWLFQTLYHSVTEARSLRLFSIIALVYLCTGLFGRAYSFHLIHSLHWPDSDVSILQGSWGSLATLTLLVGGGMLSDRVGAVRLQRWVMIGLGIFLLGFSSLYFLWHYKSVGTAGLLLTNMADPCFSVAALPALMALCQAKVEGSQFTTYMALVNFCDVLSAKINGWALTVTTAPVLGVACGATVLLLVVVLRQLGKEKPAVPLSVHSS
ncbi:MFS transporter [Hymenobacter sp. GOD-10R]|uniref:MFS transporter n=1 Tax=Hymenobacter sp. GOD-10R TaxID=3093922 RepID=UPI002D79A40E|nr:MFS transporter [Hymenobacter sp. GOD-10R]WRQ29738.1 MFS transporter [Hymenobacter sp. GOD-10R]